MLAPVSAATRRVMASKPSALRAGTPHVTRLAGVRALHSSPLRALPSKDSQDKDSLNPRSTEYSKSSSDDAAAATSETAFDPNQTSPEEQTASAEVESGEVRKSNDNNPLDASPANTEMSQPNDSSAGGAQGSPGETTGTSGRARTSGGGSPKKAGGNRSG